MYLYGGAELENQVQDTGNTPPQQWPLPVLEGSKTPGNLRCYVVVFGWSLKIHPQVQVEGCIASLKILEVAKKTVEMI